jgi:hypothetical protein
MGEAVDGPFTGMRVVVNGPRDLHPEDKKVVFAK